MIASEAEYEATLKRINYFQQQVAELRRRETNPTNYRAAVSGYLAELDRMNLAVREYLWAPPEAPVVATA
jgi:hypothetical protein